MGFFQGDLGVPERPAVGLAATSCGPCWEAGCGQPCGGTAAGTFGGSRVFCALERQLPKNKQLSFDHVEASAETSVSERKEVR